MNHETDEQKKLFAAAAQKADSAWARDARLHEVLARYGLVLPRNAVEWRAAEEGTRGEVPSLLRGSVTLLMTDGIVAYFLLGDGETTFFGHLAAFVAERPEAVATLRGGRGGAAKPKKPTSVQRALDLLNSKINNQ